MSAVALMIMGAAQPAASEPGPLAGGGSPAPTATAASTEAAPTTVAVAPAKPQPPAITMTAAINLTTQRMTVSYNGKAQHTWAISSGARGFETPAGSFKPQWTAKLWHSRKYDMAPMPHAVFFNGGIAVHATQSVGRLGSPASHGCIRLAPANAAQFYALVARHGNAHTRIAVTGSPKFYDEVASRRPRDQTARNHMAQAPQVRVQQSGFSLFSGPGYYAPQPQRVYRSASNSTAKQVRY